MIDFKSNIDVTSIMSQAQARKVLAEIFNHWPNFISFTRHARDQMRKRNLTMGDVLNVLRAGKILNAAEYVNGSFRYRMQTIKITVILTFKKPNHVVVVTAWRN